MKDICTDIEQCEVNSDAGGRGYKMVCPNCNETVVFAEHAWWQPVCQCGTWELEMIKAKLAEGEFWS